MSDDAAEQGGAQADTGDEQSGATRRTRRAVLGATGAAVVGLAGCSERADGGDAGGGDGSGYTASLAPVGEVSFESAPDRVFSITTHHADMALALGRGDDLTAVFSPAYHDSLLNAFTAPLDGVDVDWADLYDSWNPDKEQVYALDSDVHLADPANLLTMENWEESDVEEVRTEQAPWFGNSLSDRHREPPEPYGEQYRYHSLWEITEAVAAALDERARFEALASVREELLATISADLPPAAERPSVAMVLPSTADGSYWAYATDQPGFYAAHTRPLSPVDAFDAVDSFSSGDNLDSEALLEADPDVLLVLGGAIDYHDMTEIRDRLTADPVASQVTAVETDRVYPQGTRGQGPLLNLFQLEMTAKQLYPERFGEWPSDVGNEYPDFAADDQLFDHQRVADIVTGEFQA